MSAPPPTRVRLFGELSIVSRDGNAVPLHGSLRRALFAYLIARAGRPLQREEAAQLFWPEVDPSSALRSLRNILYRMKVDLAAIGVPESLIVQDHESIQLHADQLHADYVVFMADAAAIDAHGHEPGAACAACRELMRELITLYQGELLPGSYDEVGAGFQDWLIGQRRFCEQRAVHAAMQLSEYSFNLREYADCVQHCLSWLAIERWNERAYRLLMEALARLGDRNGALTAFRRCRTAVRREFGIEPELTTFDLYNRIRNGQYRAAPAPNANAASQPTERLPPQLQRIALQLRIIRQIEQPSCRLLTLVGLGGSGKSTLAELLAQRLSHFPEWSTTFIQLSGERHGGRAVEALCMGLGLRPNRGSDIYEQLRSDLSGKRRILILDRFDQLDDCRELLLRISAWPDGPRVIITARAPFDLPDAWNQPIDGLELAGPRWDGDEPWPESVQLMVSTIRQHHESFCPTREQLRQLAGAARRVDGLPLALVLIAEQYARTLHENRSDLVRRLVPAGGEDVARRIQRVIAGSWRLLKPEEHRILAALAVVQSNFSVATAHVLTAPLNSSAVPLEAQLYEFVDRGLLRIAPGQRFSWHTLVHDVAQSEFAQLPEAPTLRRAYADLFGRRALTIARQLERVESFSAENWLPELADFLSAPRIAAQFARADVLAPQLAALIRMLILTGRYDLGLSLCQDMTAILRDRGDLPSDECEQLLATIAVEEARICYYGVQIARGLACTDLAHSIAERIGADLLLLRSLTEAVRLQLVTYDLPSAARHVRAIEELRRRSTFDPRDLGYTDRALMMFYAEIGAIEDATAAAQRLVRSDTLGDRETLLTAMFYSIMLQWSVGDYRKAYLAFAALLANLRQSAPIGDDWTLNLMERLAAGAPTVYLPSERISVRFNNPQRPMTIMSLFVARLLDRLGLLEAADAAYEDALQIHFTGSGRWTRRGILASRAQCALRRGDTHAAQTLAEEGLQLSLAIGDGRFAAAAELVLATTSMAHDLQRAANFALSALQRLEPLGVDSLLAEPLAILAEIALQQGRSTEALAAVEHLTRLSRPHFWLIDDPVAVAVSASRVLLAVNDPRWTAVVRHAARHVHQIAETLPAGDVRSTFAAIPSHQKLAELATRLP